MPRTCINGHKTPQDDSVPPADVCPICGAVFRTMTPETTDAGDTLRIGRTDPNATATFHDDQRTLRLHDAVADNLAHTIATIGRYEILGEIGRGGMGVVYRAYDPQRKVIVALKTIQSNARSALSRFKREFRALADVAHRNLVSLYELAVDGATWFFTMELIEGVDFLSYVRVGENGQTPFDEQRLRDALVQVAEGLHALHGAGMLHRDVKPSNVLVSRDGRVVVLDFGLAAELDAGGQHLSIERNIVGTAVYMAPEQAAGRPVSPASDWYALGVLLYQALTNVVPFTGEVMEVLRTKQYGTPDRPRHLNAAIATDLDALCMDLLVIEPGDRPTGDVVLDRLHSARAQARCAAAAPVDLRSSIFVGREAELTTMRAWFDTMRRRCAVVACVRGKSGIGKSALLQRFTDELAIERNATVLSGRCYERESVPFKALDSLMDSLCRRLKALSTLEVQALLPRDVQPLARIFPVLCEVDAIVAAPRPAIQSPDPQELRRRATLALRELLARLADRAALVLAIDDLQWGDTDSAHLIADLLRPPDPPLVLFLLFFRSEDAERSVCVQELDAEFRRWSAAGSCDVLSKTELALEALDAETSAQLAHSLLTVSGATLEKAAAIAREAKGSPYFVHELASHVRGTGDVLAEPMDGESIDLNNVLWARISRMSEACRTMLTLLSVSGRPMKVAQVYNAARLGLFDRQPLDELRSARLIRAVGHASSDEFETYHDRIRETVVAHLDESGRLACHHRLAEVLTKDCQSDPERIAFHYQSCGEPALAAQHYVAAAERAAAALAFDRSAMLFHLALDLGDFHRIERSRLERCLGDALANAGRGSEAASAYLAAAIGAADDERLELRQRAALQWLTSGYLDRGQSVLIEVMQAVRFRVPRSARAAARRTLLGELWLRLRGLHFQRHAASEMPARDRAYIDVCWSGLVGLGVVDPAYAGLFAVKGLLRALRIGEPNRIARFLALHAAHLATVGRLTTPRVERLLAEADALADSTCDAQSIATVRLARGIAAHLQGHWQSAREHCAAAEATFKVQLTGVAWELATAQAFGLWAAAYMGMAAELRRRRPVLLREAEDRDDQYAVLNLRNSYILALALLADDQPQQATNELEESLARWSFPGFHVQHHNAILAKTLIDLYCGDGRSAFRRITDHWVSYRKSLLLKVQQIRVTLLHLRAQSAIAAALESPDNSNLLSIAEADACRLEREHCPWAAALATLSRASIAHCRRNDEAAVRILTKAVEELECAHLHLHAAAARSALGKLLGGDRGREFEAAADAWIAQQAIRNGGMIKRMVAPAMIE